MKTEKENKIKSIFVIVGVLLLSCANNTNRDYCAYEKDFNSTRKIIGLTLLDDNLEKITNEDQNTYWYQDINVIKKIHDSARIQNAYFLGKTLIFNDYDSLDKEIKIETDSFIIPCKDSTNSRTWCRLVYLYYFVPYNGVQEIGWRYKLESGWKLGLEERNDIKYEYISKNQADSILRSWQLRHPSFDKVTKETFVSSYSEVDL